MSRFVDRGAITAAFVGIGVAVTIAVSFLLIIPIEPAIWLLSIPSGLLIGYYANQRSNRRLGPWSSIVRNGVFAGFVTGLTTALLVLLVHTFFFFGDTGYPDFNKVDADGRAIPPFCQTGADCVYQRYLALGRGPELAAVGVRVNSVAPGFTDTPMTQRNWTADDGTVDEDRKAAVVGARSAQSPLGRTGVPSDIAYALLYLAVDASSFVTGQDLRPNGGVYMS